MPSHDELEDVDPTAHRAWRAQLATHLASLPADGRAEAAQDAGAAPVVELALPDELNRRLMARAAAFHHEGAVLTRGPVSAVSVPYPLTDVLELSRDLHSWSTRLRPTNRSCGLLLAAEVGVVAAPLRRRLGQLGTTLRAIDVSDRRALLRWVYARERSAGTVASRNFTSGIWCAVAATAPPGTSATLPRSSQA